MTVSTWIADIRPDKEALETTLFIGFLFWGGVNMKLLTW